MDRECRCPVSETRIATVTRDDEFIARSLDQAEAHVGRMASSPVTEHLKAKLAAFRAVLDSWTALPPTPEQVQELRAQVTVALQFAKSTSPTLRLRRIA